MTETADWVAHLIKQYPELIAWVTATLVSWPIGLSLEVGVFPDSWSDKRCILVSYLITGAVALVFSFGLWHYLDPSDPSGLDLLGSGAVAIIAPWVHKIAAQVLAHFFPWLNTSFRKPKVP